MLVVDPERFEQMVGEALDGLPPALGRVMRNVAVTVQHEPGPPGLLGLYQGVPLTQRGAHYQLALPDRIAIFQGPIEQAYQTPEAIRAGVRHTVIHELAHHFGISDDRLRELGVY